MDLDIKRGASDDAAEEKSRTETDPRRPTMANRFGNDGPLFVCNGALGIRNMDDTACVGAMR